MNIKEETCARCGRALPAGYAAAYVQGRGRLRPRWLCWRCITPTAIRRFWCVAPERAHLDRARAR